MRTGTTAAGLGLLAATLAQGAALLDQRAAAAQLDDCLLQAEVPVDERGSEDWGVDVSSFNGRVKFTPIAIAAPTTVEHIQAAVSCGIEAGVKVTPKTGGHSYASLGLGGEDGHLVIALDRMHDVTLDKDTNIATVQSGTRLGHLASELYAQGGRAIAHGTCPGVGVSGHVLHGGFGFSSHTHGLALDWVAGINVVLANSSVVHASATENPDVFWGMLGAGSNFGIVTQYEFNTFAAPANVTWFIVSLPWNQTTAAAGIQTLEAYARNDMPAELNMRVVGSSAMTQVEGSYHGNDAELQAALAPFLEKTGGRLVRSQTVDWIGSLEHYGNAKLDQTRPYKQSETFYAKNLQLKGLNSTAAENFVDYWFTVAKTVTRVWYFRMDIHGGKHSSVAQNNVDTTSYAHRDKLFLVEFYDREASGDYPADGYSFLDDWVATTTAPLAPSDWGMYINYADTSLNRTTAQNMYWGKNLAQLQALKAKLDPEEHFYYPVSLQPVAQAEVSGEF